MIHLKENDSKYDVYFKEICLGEFEKDDAGYYQFWEVQFGGSWDAWALRAIADKLDEVNKDWDLEVSAALKKINMITAKDFLYSKEPNTFIIPEQYLIEFAKLHVEAALKSAAEKATISEDYFPNHEQIKSTKIGKLFCRGEYDYHINADSILNAYDLTNIK